jgi:MFS transporter, PAT family, beta-lactamase induction signal transducer AmpG
VTLAEHRGLRLFTFCVLYVAQGIPWGFTAIALPAYLAGKHLDAAIVGTTLAMTTLPYTFKIVWAPIIDAFPSARFGKRRPWIVGAQLMMALTIGAMIAIPDLTRDLRALAWMIFIHTIFNSIQDLSTDALAVDLLDEDERGRTNGFMYASKYFGGILGAAGMSKLIAWYGMRSALCAQTGVLLAIMLVPLLFRERTGTSAPSRTTAVVDRFARLGRDLRQLATIPGAWLGGATMLVSALGMGVLAATAPVLFEQHLGWSADDYAAMTGGIGLAAGCAGAMLGGIVADKVGHRRLAAIATLALAACWLAWAALGSHWGDHTLVYTLVVVEPVCQSMLLASLFAVCMDLSWPKIGATQFGIYMALSNVSTTFGFKLAGWVSAWSFAQIYVAGAVLQLALLAVLPFVDATAVRRALAAES